MSGPRAKILILSADTNAGRAVAQSLGAAGHALCVCAVNRRHSTFASRYASWQQTHPDGLKSKAALQRWVLAQQREHAFDLIIPVTEDTLVPLHEIRNEPSLADVLALPPEPATDDVLDKEQLRQRAVELGVPTPDSVLLRSERDLEDPRIDAWLAEGVVVVKTVRSRVWHGDVGRGYSVGLVRSREQLHAHVAPIIGETALQVQRWVPGRGLGVGVLARHGRILLNVAYERIHEVPLTGGASSYRRTVEAPAGVLEDCTKLLSAFRWHGVAMVEFRYDAASDRRWLMEINGRFWGGLPLAIAAGADFPQALVSLLLHDVEPDGQKKPAIGVYARNVERDFQWMKAVLRNSDPSKRTPSNPFGKSLLEWGRVLTSRESWDGASLSDPAPIAREIASFLERDAKKITGRLARRVDLWRARSVTRRRMRTLGKAERILVLCYGNICRSPYAHARLEMLGNGDSLTVRSRGFHPSTGRPTPSHVMTEAARRGVDLSAHRSGLVTSGDLTWADAIVVMDQKNYEKLAEMAPDALGKVLWLGALDDDASVEVDDPYDLAAPGVQAVLERIDVCIDRLHETRRAGRA